MANALSVIKTGWTLAKAHKREVLLGVNIVSTGIFGYSCYKNGNEISRALRDAKTAKALDIVADGEPIKPDDVKLTAKETAKVIWKPVAKIAVPFILSGGSGVALYSIDGKIIGGLTTALGGALTTSRAIEDATRSVVGDEKLAEIKEKANGIISDTNRQIQKPAITEQLTRGFRDWDTILFIDDFGRLLELSKMDLQAWEDRINDWIESGDNFAINQFYSESGSKAALFEGEGYWFGFHERNGKVRFVVDWDYVVPIESGYIHEHSLAYKLHYVRDNGLCTLDDLKTGSPINTFNIY